MSTPLVSIIIAVYNGAHVLKGCLESITTQDYAEIELIIMDGASTDGTVALLQTWSHRIAHWRSEPDHGITHAWNKALKVARGDWVVFLGADDRLRNPTTVSDAINRILSQKHPPDIAAGLAEYVDLETGESLFIRGGDVSWQRLRLGMFIAHPGAFHRRGLWREMGAFDEAFKIAADYEFLLRKGRELRYFFLGFVTTRAGTGGVSNQQFVRARKEAYRAQRKHNSLPPAIAWAHLWIGIGAERVRNRLAPQLQWLRRMAS